jgi:hypothetical protein
MSVAAGREENRGPLRSRLGPGPLREAAAGEEWGKEWDSRPDGPPKQLPRLRACPEILWFAGCLLHR